MRAETVDDGLSTLRHYSPWQEPWLNAMPAEKIDSRLGPLPDIARIIAVWVYAYPAERIDSGREEIARSASRSNDASAVALGAR